MNTANDIVGVLPAPERESRQRRQRPGSNSDRGRALLFRADLGVAPRKAGMQKVWALVATTETLRQSRTYGAACRLL